MNKTDREAIFENGGLIREGWDWLDLSLLIMFSGLLGFIAYLSREYSLVITWLLALSALLFAVASLIHFFGTGRLQKISTLTPKQRNQIIEGLKEIGYRPVDRGTYFLNMVRDIEHTKNLYHIVLFWREGILYGYSWMDGGARFHRMPFVTGVSELNRVKRKLEDANQAAHTTPASAPR